MPRILMDWVTRFAMAQRREIGPRQFERTGLGTAQATRYQHLQRANQRRP